MRKIILMIGLLALVLSACSQNKTEVKKNTAPPDDTIAGNGFFKPFSGKIDHIHGLGYPKAGGAAFIAAHDGLKVYEQGKWFQTTTENNDYMGFSPTDTGFYTSGHPGKDSKLPNPFGIKKSDDLGQTLQNLVLEGEVDYHVMSVGYNNHVIYVLNDQSNSLMDKGIFYSEDDGKTWTKVAGQGLPANNGIPEINGMATHPTDRKIVAAFGKEGVYLSKDSGASFEKVSKFVGGTAVYLTEKDLWYGGYSNEPILVKRSLADGQETLLTLPAMTEDGVMYLAQNPQDEKEMIFTSYKSDIYLSKDSGTTWEQLSKAGEIK